MKEYQRLKTKLENRRLDFDAKLNKVHKSNKEKPELEEGSVAVDSCKTSDGFLDDADV